VLLTIGSLFIIALVGVIIGIWLAEVPDISRKAVPFSGGLLMGIALFWLLPEVAAQYGWTSGILGLIAGFGLLWLVNRFLYPVCPTCAHSHDHDACAQQLHGFAAPLIGAAALHAFVDGWGLVVSQENPSNGLRIAVLAGISLHKIPEGLALGALLLAALGNVWKTLLAAAAVQACMFAGGQLAVVVSGHMTAHGTTALLALAAGVFTYLGYHAIEGQWQRRGLSGSLVSALTGAVGAAVLRLVPGL
jgi:zinc transporter ZupT